jgi:hypothetical protein
MKNNILENFDIKKPKQVFKTPNTVDKFYEKDKGGVFINNVEGTDIFTNHVTQTIDWNSVNFDYSWNSLGLRGPEPDYSKSNRILFAGGSLCLGTGIPVDQSFPFVVADMLNASYINVSDVDTLSDLIEPLTKFTEFNPQIVVINDTRFIQMYGWALIDIYKTRNIENNDLYKKVFLECDKNFLLMFESYLKDLFPNATLVLAHCVRRAFKIQMPSFKYFKVVRLEKEEVVDLARDNAHPGILSHQAFARKIVSAIRS